MTEDFWDWLPKAYGDVGDEATFTKYNMEVAFAAGAEAKAKRMFVGLTDEEMRALKQKNIDDGITRIVSDFEYIRSIEAKLKEKNT